MSETEAKAPEKPAKSSRGGIAAILGMVLPGLLGGGAAFAGATFGANRAAGAPVEVVAEAEPEKPGPTVALEPFVMNLEDGEGRGHALRMSVSVELAHDAAATDLEPFVPRIRDATITLLRGMSFEEAAAPGAHDAVRDRLLERIREIGVAKASRVLITDFVMQ
jgi:flagellar basal body-associated protein FliL